MVTIKLVIIYNPHMCAGLRNWLSIFVYRQTTADCAAVQATHSQAAYWQSCMREFVVGQA